MNIWYKKETSHPKAPSSGKKLLGKGSENIIVYRYCENIIGKIGRWNCRNASYTTQGQHKMLGNLYTQNGELIPHPTEQGCDEGRLGIQTPVGGRQLNMKGCEKISVSLRKRKGGASGTGNCGAASASHSLVLVFITPSNTSEASP